MSDAAQKAKKPAAKKPAEHPKYSEMVVAALQALKDRTGSSRQAIEKYIKTNYKGLGQNPEVHLKLALKRMVQKGTIIHVKGTGASGSFKYNKAAAEEKKKPKKKVAAKKPAAKKTAKKPAAKKPAAKKATKSPKKSAKKPKSKKSTGEKVKKPAKKPAAKAKTAKKPAAKKAAAKKSAKKPAAKKAAKSPKK